MRCATTRRADVVTAPDRCIYGRAIQATHPAQMTAQVAAACSSSCHPVGRRGAPRDELGRHTVARIRAGTEVGPHDIGAA